MVNKRKLHHYWRLAGSLKPWHLFLLFLLLSWAAVYQLRQNSRNLEPYVEAVVIADQTGVGTDEALRNLGNYVTNHMNTQLDRPVQLAQTYQRAADKVIAAAQATANGGIYTEAQRQCEDPSIVLSARAACIQDYVTRNAPPGQEPEPVEFPDPAGYTFSFVSPLWSPDLAGWLIVLAALTFMVFTARVIAGALVRRVLRSHQ